MIEICNLRHEKPCYPYDVRVDRATILGNPFEMTDESERDLVCDKYYDYFNEQIKTNEEFLEALRNLYRIHQKYNKLRLFCWCAPKRCHA